jgi:hypothetical protein
MTPTTKGGAEFGPEAIERIEWLAQRDLGAAVPSSQPDRLEPAGHWRRYVRDAHPPRFPAPDGIEVATVEVGGAAPFAATAVFGLRQPARVEDALAALPGKPGWRCYVTRTGGDAVASAAIFTADEISVLAIDAATANRRSAARSALLHRIIEDAIASGSRLIAARADEQSEGRDAAAGLLLAGFEKAYLCPAWVDAGLPAS